MFGGVMDELTNRRVPPTDARLWTARDPDTGAWLPRDQQPVLFDVEDGPAKGSQSAPEAVNAPAESVHPTDALQTLTGELRAMRQARDAALELAQRQSRTISELRTELATVRGQAHAAGVDAFAPQHNDSRIVVKGEGVTVIIEREATS